MIRKAYNNYYKNSEFGRNIIKLASGTAISQIIGLLMMPILARLYSPEAFGELGVFLSISAILGGLVSLKYDFAIVLPKKDSTGGDLFVLSICLTLALSSIISFLIFLFKSQLSQLLGLENQNSLFYGASLMIFCIGIFSIFTKWLTRKKEFGSITKATLLQKSVTQVSSVTFGLLGHVNGVFLIISKLLGIVLTDIFLFFRVLKDKDIFTKSTCTNIKINAEKYNDFPKYNVWSSLLNTASQQMPILLLSYFFTTNIVGHFTLSLQILGIPIFLIGNSIGQVFFQKASDASHNNSLAPVIEKLYKNLITVGIFPFIAFIIIGEDLFTSVLGSKWSSSGIYAQYLSLWIFALFIYIPISSGFTILRKQKFILIWNIFLFILRVTAISIGGIIGNELISIGLFSIIGFLNYLLLSIILFKLTGISNLKALILFLKVLFYSIIFLSPIFIGKYLDINWIWLLIEICFLYSLFLVFINYYKLLK